MNNVIQTFTGKAFDPMNPDSDLIAIKDIAHALSNTCRFSGHCKSFYSVAEHSVRVALLMQDQAHEVVLAALLHDASEAYLNDIPTPIKERIPNYQKAEKELQRRIFLKFCGDDKCMTPPIKRADLVLLATEKRDLMVRVEWQWAELPAPLSYRIEPWRPHIAERNFLWLYDALLGKKTFDHIAEFNINAMIK